MEGAGEMGWRRITFQTVLKEQYPVTAHAPNFDIWTGCPEIKRCEESKRTLKNPFAFGPNLDFLALLLLPLAGGPKDAKRFDAD